MMQKEIERLKEELINHLKWGRPSDWHNSMFDDLSEKIFQKTGTSLSPSTLKRFLDRVNYQGKLSVNTYDTICKFLDYENWRSYRVKHLNKSSIRPRLKINQKAFYVGAGFVLAVFVGIIISNRQVEIDIDNSDYKFSSRVLDDNYPKGVQFKYGLPKGLISDSTFIQQYWDPRRTIKISKHDSIANGTYYFPGFFRAKLLINDKVLREHELFLKSDGWMGTIEYEGVPKYFDPIIKENGLYYPQEIIEEVNDSENELYSIFHIVDSFSNISADDFSLSFRMQSISENSWAICRHESIYILGNKTAMIIPLSKLGCTSENNIMLGSIYLKGNKYDLSSLNASMNSDELISINVKNKYLEVFKNDQIIYQLEYRDNIGSLVGLRFKSQGLIEISEIELMNSEDHQIDINL